MLHHLSRHNFPVVAHFDFTLALTFSLPAAAVAARLYPGLRPDTFGDQGFFAMTRAQKAAK